MWKLFHSALPVDLALQRKHVSIASRCVCCSYRHARESLDHLFLHSDIAQFLWGRFAAIFNKVSRYVSIQHLFDIWAGAASARSQLGACQIGILCFVCWEIWKARCSAVYDAAPVQVNRIFAKVVQGLQELMFLYQPKTMLDPFGCTILQHLRLPIKDVVARCGQWLCWVPPCSGQFKLNTNGSSKDGVCTCGGIIRDSCGYMVCAFSHFYGPGTNMLAEISALRDGLRLCRSLNLMHVLVETDSAVAALGVTNSQQVP